MVILKMKNKLIILLSILVFTSCNEEFLEVTPVGRVLESNFYQNQEQKESALKVLESVDKSNLWPNPIVTAVEPLTKYYVAEDYHQNYYNQNTEQGYCSAIIGPKVQKFQKKYKDLLR